MADCGVAYSLSRSGNVWDNAAMETVRGGGLGFGREAFIAWCEDNDVDCPFSGARNRRLPDQVQAELAEGACESAGATVYNWSRRRQVFGKPATPRARTALDVRPMHSHSAFDTAAETHL